MIVAIIEDDDDKMQQLHKFVLDLFPTASFLFAKSLQSGSAIALSGKADLILLDMTMRNFDRTIQDDGGRPHHFAGREILRRMRRAQLCTPIVIITNFDRFGEEDELTTLTELKAELKAKFPNYYGTVEYRGNTNDWKAELKLIVDIISGGLSA